MPESNPNYHPNTKEYLKGKDPWQVLREDNVFASIKIEYLMDYMLQNPWRRQECIDVRGILGTNHKHEINGQLRAFDNLAEIVGKPDYFIG